GGRVQGLPAEKQPQIPLNIEDCRAASRRAGLVHHRRAEDFLAACAESFQADFLTETITRPSQRKAPSRTRSAFLTTRMPAPVLEPVKLAESPPAALPSMQ